MELNPLLELKLWDLICSLKRQYPPITLLQLQMLIDTNRLDAKKPIDIAALCNTKVCYFQPTKRHYGFNLTDEASLDKFSYSFPFKNFSYFL